MQEICGLFVVMSRSHGRIVTRSVSEGLACTVPSLTLRVTIATACRLTLSYKAVAMAYNKLKVLFLCTGNSCRSQMAEGWAKTLAADTIEPYSAGIEKHGLNPKAVAVMQEVGVDIREQRSKTVDELDDVQFDVVVTVCGHADEHCPSFHGAPRVIHVAFDDPPKLAATTENEEDALQHYRRVRDEIRDFVKTAPERLRAAGN
jgi:arsenate reductase